MTIVKTLQRSAAAIAAVLAISSTATSSASAAPDHVAAKAKATWSWSDGSRASTRTFAETPYASGVLPSIVVKLPRTTAIRTTTLELWIGVGKWVTLTSNRSKKTTVTFPMYGKCSGYAEYYPDASATNWCRSARTFRIMTKAGSGAKSTVGKFQVEYKPLEYSQPAVQAEYSQPAVRAEAVSSCVSSYYYAGSGMTPGMTYGPYTLSGTVRVRFSGGYGFSVGSQAKGPSDLVVDMSFKETSSYRTPTSTQISVTDVRNGLSKSIMLDLSSVVSQCSQQPLAL